MTDSVSKKISYQVLGEAPGATSYPQGKFQKAQELGLEVIDELGLKTLADEAG